MAMALSTYHRELLDYSLARTVATTTTAAASQQAAAAAIPPLALNLNHNFGL